MVPGGNTGADVGSEGVHAAVDAAFDKLSGEFGEPRHRHNIPDVATMTPIVSELVASMPDLARPDALCWALALGADFGGNLTVAGASANVVMLGIARRADNPISFWESRSGPDEYADRYLEPDAHQSEIERAVYAER